MNKELVIRKCESCGATVKVLQDCNCDCGIVCCGEKMEKLPVNVNDVIKEKHLPQYEVKDGKLFIKVNHVMEEDHYIEWISIIMDNVEKTVYFKPGDEPATQICKYVPGTLIYSYCNKHGLWKTVVE